MSDKRTWLEGPQLPGQHEDPRNLSSYPGEAMGLPKDGPGALASLMPRMVALTIDWFICWGLAFFIHSITEALGGISTITFMLFCLWRIVTVWLFAQSPGHAIMGIGVARLDYPDQRVGLLRSIIRVLLTIFLIPPVVMDSDGRGLHDRVTQTAVIKTR